MKQQKVYDRACSGCAYLGWIAGYIGYCSYMFKTDKRRPCPPGKGCTVKQKKGKKVAEDG